MAEIRLGEFDLIERIRAGSASNDRVLIGIGDDCAALRFRAGAEVLVTTDMLMEGRHFLRDRATLPEIGYKALAVNLSDIAAMAGQPIAAVVAVALPKGETLDGFVGLHNGMNALAKRFGVALVGGDTNAWDGPLIISITVMGESTGRGPVRRSGAKPGDALFVTGPLGGSLLGRHLRPLPRIEEALALHREVDLHAMIDLSDGLAGDLGHILAESGGLGAILNADAIPIHPDAHRVAKQDGTSPLDHALGDGEDFELCFTVSPADADRLLASPPPGVSLYRIGSIEAEPGIRLRDPDGRVAPCSVGGFDHLAQPKSGGNL